MGEAPPPRLARLGPGEPRLAESDRRAKPPFSHLQRSARVGWQLAAARPKATRVPTAAPTPVVTVGSSYAAFIDASCHAFAAGDTNTISNELPYYQYNSGLRYGTLGDGEGQTGDPSLLGTWLQGGTVRCQYFTPDVAGHGTLLTSGWQQPGGWSLIELDTFNGAWKINDFTFGDCASLYRAMQTSQPIVTYHGH